MGLNPLAPPPPAPPVALTATGALGSRKHHRNVTAGSAPTPYTGPTSLGVRGMAAIGRYDSDLQMFVEESRDAQRAHLRFLRWLVERGDLEHPAFGPPSGALTMVGCGRTIAPDDEG
jgi:hypothetical protein